ncbi:MAG TPA: hypothetical protein VLV82_00615 [Candidatus Angelobacter sp.]|nr:hypothetical protein [Candidatus Angelobacter sp.]
MAVHRVSRDRIESTVAALGPGPWPYGELLAHGWTPRQLEGCVRRGALARIRRGVYAVPSPSVLDFTTPHFRAVVARLSSRSVLSHESAALLHGMWVPGPLSPVVHVTLPRQADRRSAGLRVHASRLTAESVTTVEGLRVTTIARTAVDLAKGRTLPHAAVAIDGGLRRLVEAARPQAARELRSRMVPDAVLREARQRLEDACDGIWSWPGSRVVRAALDMVEPASESPFESWSRGWMASVGLPRPVVNAEVFGDSGRRYFGDFVWRGRRLIGEADGMGKYGGGETVALAALRAERQRQADLEAAGWRIVRWSTGERGAQVVARLARALYLDQRLAA